MGFFSPDQPDDRVYGEEMGSTLGAQSRVMPKWFKQEAQWQPEYAKLAANTYGSLLGSLQGILNDSRAQNVASFGALAPELGAAVLQGTGNAGLMGALNTRALEELAMGSSVDASTANTIRRSTMGGAGARGWGLDPGDMARVGLQTGAAGQALRQQRFGNASNVAQMNNAFTSPYLSMLFQGADPTATAGMGLLGQSGPKLFNPESAYAGNIFNQNQQMAAQFAEPSTLAKLNMLQNTAGNSMSMMMPSGGGSSY
jgi:hypothetical protein